MNQHNTEEVYRNAYQGFSSFDVCPCGLLFKKIGKENLTAKIVKGSNESPPGSRVWRPAMVRCIMLDKGSHACCDYLPVMNGFPAMA
jgi:hypothetical protein